MRRDQIVTYGALAIVALFLAYTLATRFHDGRCQSRAHWGRSMSALDCTLTPAPPALHAPR